MKTKNLFAKLMIVAVTISCLLQSNEAFAQNKSNEKIPPLPKLLSLREQMDVRAAR